MRWMFALVFTVGDCDARVPIVVIVIIIIVLSVRCCGIIKNRSEQGCAVMAPLVMKLSMVLCGCCCL